MINNLLGLFSRDIGIDLGTANTLVFVKGSGIVIAEPSVVTIHKKSKEVLAVGNEAKRMIGKTPPNIEVVRPLREGVISDFEVTEKMLAYFIRKVHETPSLIPRIPRPRVVIGIPSNITEVERRAVHDASVRAGARQVFLVEEALAAAIGANLPIEEPTGNMIVDIGGGTTEIAVISLGGIVIGKTIRTAGDSMDDAIIRYVRDKYNLLLGAKTAEEIKIGIGAAIVGRDGNYLMRGRDLATGLPNAVNITSNEVREALSSELKKIIQATKDAVEETPPELVSDVLRGGVTLVGGVSLLWGLDKLISQETGMPVYVPEEPLTCVVRGTGKILEEMRLLKKIQILSQKIG